MQNRFRQTIYPDYTGLAIYFEYLGYLKPRWAIMENVVSLIILILLKVGLFDEEGLGTNCIGWIISRFVAWNYQVRPCLMQAAAFVFILLLLIRREFHRTDGELFSSQLNKISLLILFLFL